MRVAAGGESHHEEALVQLADGHAALGGREVFWRTAGVYRVAGGKLAEAWLVPLDQEHFDRVRAATRPLPFVYTQRVRLQECATSSGCSAPSSRRASRMMRACVSSDVSCRTRSSRA